MKKKFFISLLILSFGILSIILFGKHKTYTEIDGIKYAIQVNGTSSNTFPSGNYKSDVSCTNAHGYWDNAARKVIVESITGSVICDISFTSITSSDYLNTYITGLNNTTQGDGKVVSENGYRYEGKNPNNYIWFNNELWRIIGVFDSSSHGLSGKNLVKIIRDESIGGLAWDKNNSNDWVSSSLKALLNGAYYNHTIDTENCYQYSTTVPGTCDFTAKGIRNEYQNMIENVTWYLGGGGKDGYTTYTPDSVYGYERNSDAIYSGNSASTTGKIGLMYESDYLYGVLASDCVRTTAHNLYGTNSCAGKDWLSGQGDVWSISPNHGNAKYVWYVKYYGYVYFTYANAGLAVRPVLYLSSSVYRVSGTGSLTDPYIIGM